MVTSNPSHKSKSDSTCLVMNRKKVNSCYMEVKVNPAWIAQTLLG